MCDQTCLNDFLFGDFSNPLYRDGLKPGRGKVPTTMEAIFTYGTLAIPEVMQIVTGRDFPFCDGVAPNFVCLMVQDRVYPGITPKQEESTEGKVYLDVDPRSLELLDLFEDKFYDREPVKVAMRPGESTITAYAYVVSREHQHILSNEPWDREYFIETHLRSYLEACRYFHLHWSGQDTKPLE